MSTVSLVLWTAILQTTLGGCGHRAPKGMSVDPCAVCDVESARIVRLIQCLQGSPDWRKRDDAAHDLAKFNGKRHPEVVDALALALLQDRHEEVREEAAESLKKLAPCTPIAHLALTRASKCDPDHATRKQASKALKSMGKRCVEPCRICQPDLVVGSLFDLAPKQGGPILILPERNGESATQPDLQPLPGRSSPALPPPLEPGLEEEIVPPPPTPALRPTQARRPVRSPAA